MELSAPETYYGGTLVANLAPSVLTGSSSFLQVTRTCFYACPSQLSKNVFRNIWVWLYVGLVELNVVGT